MKTTLIGAAATIVGAILGAVLTIIFSSDRLVVNIDGKSITVHSSQYQELIEKSEALSVENDSLLNKNDVLNGEIEELKATIKHYTEIISPSDTFDKVKIKFLDDGLEQKLPNSTAILYNGHPFFQLNVLEQISTKEVLFDKETMTLILGEKGPEKGYLVNLCSPYQSNGYDTPAVFKIAGDEYTHGFTLPCHNGYALFNLKGSFDTLEFDLGYVSGNKVDCLINFFTDGQLTRTIEMGCEDLPQHFQVPLDSALQLKIEMSPGGNTARYGFANVVLS